MKVYSPSQTETFSQCQVKRQLQKHWKPKIMEKPGIAAAMGTAMAAGLAVFNRGRMENKLRNLIEVKDACVQEWNAELEHFRKAGGVIMDETHVRLPDLMTRGLETYALNDPIPQEWKIVGVEYEFKDWGNARADVVIRNEHGFAPVDHKMKESLYVKQGETKDAARARTLLEYEHSFKMLHYVYAVNKTFGPCDRYYIILGELKPGKPHYMIQEFPVDERTLTFWWNGAFKYWAQMNEVDTHEDYPAPAAIHDSKYGKCEFYWACFNAHLDAETMKAKYVQIERRNSAIQAAREA